MFFNYLFSIPDWDKSVKCVGEEKEVLTVMCNFKQTKLIFLNHFQLNPKYRFLPFH